MSEWQPIKTAPQDGTNVDVWAHKFNTKTGDKIERRIPDAYYSGNIVMRGWKHKIEKLDDWNVTHWMPLPDGPNAHSPEAP